MVPAAPNIFGPGAGPGKGPPGWRAGLLSVGLVLGVACLVVAVGWLGFTRMWSWVTNLEEFRAAPIDVNIDAAPWLKQAAFQKDLLARDLAEFLRDRDGRPRKWSIYTAGLSRRVAHAYERSPWVLQVRAVRKRFPNFIEIELDLRKPFAVVGRRSGADVILDKDCVVLPADIYEPPPGPAGRVPIRPTYRSTPPLAGSAWQDDGVRSACRLLSFLLRKAIVSPGGARPHMTVFDCVDLEAIEVNKPGLVFKKVPLVLLTESGARILWGRAPQEGRPPSPAEASPERKLTALIAAARPPNKHAKERSYGPDLAGVAELDLRWDKPAVKMR